MIWRTFWQFLVSNMVPPTELTFDGDKQLTMGDVQGLLIHLKWAISPKE